MINTSYLLIIYYEMSDNKVKITGLHKHKIIVVKCQTINYKTRTLLDNAEMDVFSISYSLFLSTIAFVADFAATCFSQGLWFLRIWHLAVYLWIGHEIWMIFWIFFSFAVVLQAAQAPASFSTRTATLRAATTSFSISSATQAAQDTKSSASGRTTSELMWVNFLFYSINNNSFEMTPLHLQLQKHNPISPELSRKDHLTHPISVSLCMRVWSGGQSITMHHTYTLYEVLQHEKKKNAQPDL